MKSFKNFNEGAASMMSGSDTARQKKIDKQGSTPTGAKKAIQGVMDYLAPPASRSNEPTVRSGERTSRTGFNYVPSRDKKGERYDKTGTPAPAKLDKGTRGTTMPSNPQFKGVGARTKPKTDERPRYSADDAAKDQEAAKLKAQQEREKRGGGSTPPKAKPQKPSAKDDPRNAQYNKMRKDLNATTFQSKKDKEGATKATEKIGKDAWAKANPKLAAAKKKRDETRGTSKSTNPLMKGFGDRSARKKELERIRGGAALKSIGSSKNADKILSGRSASKDSESIAKKSYNRVLTGDPKKGLDKPKAEAPKADTPKKDAAPKADAPKAAAPKAPEAKAPEPKKNSVSLGKPGDGFTGPTATIGGRTYGIPSGSAPKTTQPAAPKPAAPKSSINVDLKNKSGSANLGGNKIDVKFSKGGEKKKYKKESVKSFSDFIEEQKKTKVKINPKKDDLLEGGYSKGGEICSKCDGEGCNHCNNTGKHSKVNKEDYAYVSQEEVSEEGYQEGYETETDLTEALPGSTNPNYYDSKKDFKSAFKSNPGAFKSPLPSMGNRPAGTVPRGRPGLYTGKDAYRPMPVWQQKAMFNSKIGQKLMGGDNKQGFYKSAMKANNVQIGKPPAAGAAGTAGGANKPAAPKPNPMQANRPGYDSKGVALKPDKNKLDGKKPLAASRQLMPFGKFRNLSEEQLNEFLGKIFGAVSKGVQKVAKPQAQPQGQAQPQKPTGIASMVSAPAAAAAASAPPMSSTTNVAKFDASGKSRFQKGIGEFAPKASPSATAVQPSGPKPKPMQANRPGFDTKGIAKKLAGRMKSYGGQVKKESFELEEGREEDAKKSLDAVKKRQGVLDDYEKKTGKKLDITKTPEHKSHKQNFPGAKRTGKKKRGEKESELETHNRRVNKYSERLRKYGKTKKQKEYDDGMAKHTSRFD